MKTVNGYLKTHKSYDMQIQRNSRIRSKLVTKDLISVQKQTKYLLRNWLCIIFEPHCSFQNHSMQTSTYEIWSDRLWIVRIINYTYGQGSSDRDKVKHAVEKSQGIERKRLAKVNL